MSNGVTSAGALGPRQHWAGNLEGTSEHGARTLASYSLFRLHILCFPFLSPSLLSSTSFYLFLPTLFIPALLFISLSPSSPFPCTGYLVFRFPHGYSPTGSLRSQATLGS